MSIIRLPSSCQLVTSNSSSILMVFCEFFTWIVLGNVDLGLSFILVTKASAVEGELHQLRVPIVQPTRCTCYLKLFILVKQYMFRTVFMSIMRSSKLRIQQRYMSNSCCYLLLSGMRCSISSLIVAGNSSCLTYTIAVYAVLSP